MWYTDVRPSASWYVWISWGESGVPPRLAVTFAERFATKSVKGTRVAKSQTLRKARANAPARGAWRRSWERVKRG